VDKAGADFAWVASDPSLENVTGKYFINRKTIPTCCASNKEKSQEKLWDFTEKLLCNKND
jgi:hypothetical protein